MGILVGIAILVALGVALLAIDRRMASEIEERSGSLADQRIHLERVTSLWRDCQRTHTALLELWLGSSDPRGERGRKVLMRVADVRRVAAEFAKLPPSGLEEQEVRTRLGDTLVTWSERVHSSITEGEGADHLEELRTLLARVDQWAGRVVDVNSAAGEDTAARLKVLHDSRSTVQLGFVATLAGILLLTVGWRGRVRAEARQLEQVRLTQQRAANLRAEFFANMSHELRTPLVAIGGFSAVIEQQQSLDAETREQARQIQRAAKDLLGIINNILDVAKLESDHVELLIEDVSLEEVLERCAARCRGLIGDKALELDVKVPRGLPPVRGDFVKLQQLFTNLISNAVKFTESGKVTVRAAASSGSVSVTVEDTGIGIRPDALQSIWEPFRQADHKVSRKFGGTGLGLAIVRGVVNRLGGKVTVESTVGIGTTFTVTLPAGGVPAPVAGTPAPVAGTPAPRS